jgi:hypothetical protein
VKRQFIYVEVVEIKGIINLDLILAFIFTIAIFSIVLNFVDVLNYNSISMYEFESETINSISRSYEIISEISNGRDNEISLIKLELISPSNVSLNSPIGRLYGEKLDCLYIRRAVYIIELQEVGYIEVC